jgi:predicted nucleic acid-binding protein
VNVVDASVMVGALYPPDLHHLASRAWLRQEILAGDELIAPLLLLSEVAGAVTRRSGDRALGRQAVQRLVALRQLRLVPLDVRLSVLSTQIAIDLQLRGADAIYVALAAQIRIPLITWDREQFERGAQRIITRRPDMP